MYNIHNEEKLKKKVSMALNDLKIESYVFNGNLVHEISIIYLKFDTWISIVFDDGVLFFQDRTPEYDKYEAEGNTFENPELERSKILNLDSVLNKRLEKYKIYDFTLELEFEGGIKIFCSEVESNNPGYFEKITLQIV